MISRNKIKLIKSLSQKKIRLKNKLFLAEGNKLIFDILNSQIEIKTLICTDDFFSANKNLISGIEEVILTKQEEIDKASLLKTPQQSIALCTLPEVEIKPDINSDGLSLCLDGIQDPGNLGTIIRIADWFGINIIYASKETVDVYNPKTVQASMGAITRVKVIYHDLAELIVIANKNKVPVYGALMNGENIYTKKLSQKGLIIMGNEGQGISASLEHLIANKITIPGLFHGGKTQPDSLNVSMATAIICSEFRRDILKNKSSFVD